MEDMTAKMEQRAYHVGDIMESGGVQRKVIAVHGGEIETTTDLAWEPHRETEPTDSGRYKQLEALKAENARLIQTENERCNTLEAENKRLIETENERCTALEAENKRLHSRIAEWESGRAPGNSYKDLLKLLPMEKCNRDDLKAAGEYIGVLLTDEMDKTAMIAALEA